MSYFDDASLVMIPSGYKTSKVYSVKPTDGSGDLTFSRSNDTATRVNSAGLIEKVRTNLVLHSQAFDNVSWVTFQPSGAGTITRTSNYATAPDGTMTATRIVNTGSSPFQWVYQSFTHPNNTLSVWAKSTSGTNQTFRLFGSNGGLNSANFTATNTWQRFTFSVSTVTTAQPLGITADSSGNAYDILFWGFQFETGDIATDYIATTSAAVSVGPVANVPRLDYLNSSCPRLLLEPQRQNVLNFSESFDNAYWPKSDVSVTANAGVSPDGYTNADKLIASATNANHLLNKAGALSVTSGQAYTFSLFAKAAEYNFVRVQIQASTFNQSWANFNLSNGTVGLTSGGIATKIEDYGNGWYRCSVTSTATSTGGSGVQPFVLDSDRGTDSPSYLGNGTSGILIYGAQFEAGAYATSYIPTLGAAVTRGADAASKTGISSLIGQTEGTLFADFIMPPSGTLFTHYRISGTGGLFNNSQNITITATNQIRGWSFTGSSEQAQINSGIYAEGTRVKVAYAYKANDFVLYVNGVQIGTDTSGTVPAMSELLVGSYYPDTSLNVINRTSQALLFKTRLSNADLAALTA